MDEDKFYVTHYFNEEPPMDDSIKRVSFLTSRDNILKENSVFYQGFDTGRIFTKKDLELKLEHKSLIQFLQPFIEISESEGLWMDRLRGIYIIDYENPFGEESTKVKIS